MTTVVRNLKLKTSNLKLPVTLIRPAATFSPDPGGEGILPKHTGPALGPPFSLCGPLRLCVLCV